MTSIISSSQDRSADDPSDPSAGKSLPLELKAPVEVRVLFLGERLDLRDLAAGPHLWARPLAVRAGQEGVAVLFRYGAVVLFALPPVEEASFLKSLAPMIQGRFAKPETDEARLLLAQEGEERAGNDLIHLRELSLPRLLIVADILAKSVVLAHYEVRLLERFDRLEPIASQLRHGVTRGRAAKELLGHVGDTLLMQQRMVGRAEVSDRPETLWECPELETLFQRLQDEYELTERHRALDRKLELIQETAKTVLDLSNFRRSLRVEWYIVFLIVVEILLTLYELFVRGH
ncbi:hypothetical protein Pan216_14320 [Planctomycetes bacterium Pan216]|uniref:DUF155 domain-containing protein n=1 Tax=Kolteria novifilia TaxID=2527975 RepID=A0A518B0V1_9BACT|nr:hypothetical protein Pan216_14320 [Planctomycetes bacterium Pan216]